MKKLSLNFVYIILFHVGYVYSSEGQNNQIIWTKSDRLGDQLYVGIQYQLDGSLREFTANSESEKDAGGRRRALLESQNINRQVPFQQLAIVIPKRKKSSVITTKPTIPFSGEEKAYEVDDTVTL